MNPASSTSPPGHRLLRLALAIGLALLVAVYTVAVVLGVIPETQRIDAVHFGIILAASIAALMLLRPDLADRLKRLEGAGFKLEMLARVREKQQEQDQTLRRQADTIDDISLVLPLLLPKSERKHLMNLQQGRTDGYKGRGSLRSEIRRLRSIGLLEMLPERTVGQMETGKAFDLADYVRLTELGHRWVRRIEQIEAKEADDEPYEEQDEAEA